MRINKIELKPCPFCGSKNVSINGLSISWIECNECEMETKQYETREEAIKSWNTRYFDDFGKFMNEPKEG